MNEASDVPAETLIQLRVSTANPEAVVYKSGICYVLDMYVCIYIYIYIYICDTILYYIILDYHIL